MSMDERGGHLITDRGTALAEALGIRPAGHRE